MKFRSYFVQTHDQYYTNNSETAYKNQSLPGWRLIF